MSRQPEPAPRLSVPPEGIRAGGVVLRLPVLDDVDALLPGFTDPELREAGNLPAFGRDELAVSLGELPELAETGRLLPLAAVEEETGEVAASSTTSMPSGRSLRSATSYSQPRAAAGWRRRLHACSQSTRSR
jgi:hypothetical protein